MSVTGVLRDLSNELAKKQPKQVDHLTEETPVLSVVPFEPSSHPLHNVYDEVTDITGGGFVDLDAPLEQIDVASKLSRVDLSVMGGKMWCPEDKAKAFGGHTKYFAKKMPKALRKLGNVIERTIIYNNMLAYARQNNLLINAGGTSNKNHLLLAVRFVAGETTGLYSPEGFKNGALLDAMPINGGTLYENAEGVLGYGVRLKNYFGMQFANPQTVAAIVNTDNVSDTKCLPTAAQVDDLLDSVRAGENTHLFCHRKMLSVLAQVGKDGAFRMTPSDRNVDRRIAEWNGVGIVSSFNFNDATESNIAVS